MLFFAILLVGTWFTISFVSSAAWAQTSWHPHLWCAAFAAWVLFTFGLVAMHLAWVLFTVDVVAVHLAWIFFIVRLVAAHFAFLLFSDGLV